MVNKDYSNVIKNIDVIAQKIYDDFEKAEIPNLQLPTRTKANIPINSLLTL